MSSIELRVVDISHNDISGNKDLSDNGIPGNNIPDINERHLLDEISPNDDTEISDLDGDMKVNRLVEINDDKRNIMMKVKDLDANADELLECGYYLGKYRKVTYKQVNDKINDLYFEQNEYYSAAMDILATYVKGQKLIYMESKFYCETRLNFLMFPAIFLSSLTSSAYSG